MASHFIIVSWESSVVYLCIFHEKGKQYTKVSLFFHMVFLVVWHTLSGVGKSPYVFEIHLSSIAYLFPLFLTKPFLTQITRTALQRQTVYPCWLWGITKCIYGRYRAIQTCHLCELFIPVLGLFLFKTHWNILIHICTKQHFQTVLI